MLLDLICITCYESVWLELVYLCDWLFIYGFANDEFCEQIKRYSTATHTLWMHNCTMANIGTMCVLSARISYSSYSWCVQIVNVYAFNETRNVIQCKLGDELEMSRTNERTNEKIIQCVMASDEEEEATPSCHHFSGEQQLRISIGTAFLIYQRKVCFSRVKKFESISNQTEAKQSKVKRTNAQAHTLTIYSITCCIPYNHYVNDGKNI